MVGLLPLGTRQPSPATRSLGRRRPLKGLGLPSIKPLQQASGWYIVVTFPGGLQEHIPGFKNEAEAQRWNSPARGRNVSLSEGLTHAGNKEKATLWTPNPRNKNRKLCRLRLLSSQSGMYLKFLPTRILRKREVPSKQAAVSNGNLKAIPMELILIIVILVLLFGGGGFTAAHGVFGCAH